MKLQLVAVFLLVTLCHVMSQPAPMQGDPNAITNMNLMRAIMMSRQRAQNQGQGQSLGQQGSQNQGQGQGQSQGQGQRWGQGQSQGRGQRWDQNQGQAQTQYVPIYVPQQQQGFGFGSLLTGALVAQHDPFEDFLSNMF